MANKSYSGNTVILNIHYKNHAFLMTQNARDILTMEDVSYSGFVIMVKIRMCS